MNELHKQPYSGYPWYQKMITMIRKYFFWPNMKKEVGEYLPDLQVVTHTARCLLSQVVSYDVDFYSQYLVLHTRLDCGCWQLLNGQGASLTLNSSHTHNYFPPLTLTVLLTHTKSYQIRTRRQTKLNLEMWMIHDKGGFIYRFTLGFLFSWFCQEILVWLAPELKEKCGKFWAHELGNAWRFPIGWGTCGNSPLDKECIGAPYEGNV